MSIGFVVWSKLLIEIHKIFLGFFSVFDSMQRSQNCWSAVHNWKKSGKYWSKIRHKQILSIVSWNSVIGKQKSFWGITEVLKAWHFMSFYRAKE